MVSAEPYRGRIAPSPTGYLHLGHARTFLIAAERPRQFSGSLIFRNEDLDQERCRPEFVSAMFEDMRWLDISWDEGPDCGGAFAPYSQSDRREHYLDAWKQLRDAGLIYPCTCSRKDLALSASAPNNKPKVPRLRVIFRFAQNHARLGMTVSWSSKEAGDDRVGQQSGKRFLIANYHERVISSGAARPLGGRGAESRDLVVKMR
ncbi:MAG: Glutamate--tRNA ligase [Acidobacteriaceae bacterium]|nr:Glutamate--tRNA ligase [Acidobacteriaceae bacterium]